MGWLGFLIGLMVGGTVGALVMAVISAGAEFDRAMGARSDGRETNFGD